MSQITREVAVIGEYSVGDWKSFFAVLLLGRSAIDEVYG